MARTGLMATTSSFAHLLGLSGASAGKSKAEDEPTKPKKEEDDDSAKGKGKAKADEKPDDQGEDESDEDYKERKRREEEEAKASDDDDDEKDDKAKAARMRERARCSAIFATPAAGVRPDLAAHFAFSTNLSRADAVATLTIAAQGGAAAPKRQALGERMGRDPNPDLGRDPGEQQALKPHQRLMAAHAKATGKKA